MKVLHLASANRWTGAAAPAFAEVESLREAGTEAHYAYVGGYKLEAKIGHLGYAHAAIEKAQNPAAFYRTVAAIERIVEQHGIDLLHAHLTYDHWIARTVARRRKLRLARTFHARRVLRRDPFSAHLIRRTDHVFVINDAFRDAPTLRGRNVIFTPPPLDLRQFTPEGPNARALYGFAPDAKVITVIGKLSAGRGFEEALQTFAALRASGSDARMMIIGHGEHRPTLERLAQALNITPHVTFAGYHEDDLAEHYRASDVLLFTARGSDEGHRAVLEAMACGVVPATFPIEGMDALAGTLPLLARDPSPQSLAQHVAATLKGDLLQLRAQVITRSHDFAYGRAAERLLAGYR
ncbi:MAG TPA: glycosyltransferase family 4 protein [Thermoanaerobaculia bacterium]|nr:glycosyltransferase family 4 protein [Thermoanaerobaculia bacterium]